MSRQRRWRIRGLLLAPLLVLLIGQAGCVSSQPTKTADAGLKVDVLQLDDGGFRVELRRDEPLREWLFLRTPAIDMRERWRWLSDGAVLEKRGKRDVVVLPKARRVLRFEVPPDDRFVQADYSLTQTFANDAGVVLYVGHFAAAEESACPETVNASPPCTAQGAVSYWLMPRPGAHVWLNATLSEQSVQWLDTDSDGTMAYFGSVKPEVVGDAQILLDPNLPQWMRDELPAFMSTLVERYTTRYGQALEFTPRLLFSFGGGHPRRTSLYGGVVDRMVALSVLGDLWLEPSEQARQRYLYLIAHEVAHLWNGGQFQHDHSTGASWLHEGNADAAARAAGFDLGFFDEATLWSERTNALGSCLRDANEPLNEAGKRGNFSLYYTCGEVIELLVEGAARKVGQPALAHWRSLFAQLGNDNNEYDQEAYLAAVGAVTSDLDLVEFIQRWVEQGLPSNEALYQQLVESGIQLGGLRDDNVGRAQFAALMHVFSLDCTNGFSLSHRPAGVQVRGNGSCVLLPDQWLDIESIAGVPVTGSGAALVETIARACEHFDPLPVVGSLKEDHEVGSEELPNGVQVEIPMGCHKPFRFVELTGWAQ